MPRTAMQQRLPLLIVTGALAFGSIAYFLFFFDDGSIPTRSSAQHPLAVGPHRQHTGAGANSAAIPAGQPPAGQPPMTPPVPIATTPAPADTGPPE